MNKAIWQTWTETRFQEEMDKARLQGDQPTDGIDADELMEEVLLAELENQHTKSKSGRAGYNRMLDIADYLVRQPELALVNHSRVSTFLEKVPERARDFFDPVEAPDWVDEDQLELATTLWDRHMIAMLLGLFSSSLPACYLIRNGIVALYDTRKLADSKYVDQRLYETSLMLDHVMAPGGITVIKDARISPDEATISALDDLAPKAWEMLKGHIKIEGDKIDFTGAPGVPDPKSFGEMLFERAKTIYAKARPKRYLWGKGFISVRKVRALHSSMRFMLRNPGKFHRGPAAAAARPGAEGDEQRPASFRDEIPGRPSWDVAQYGLPINQEDQAYTLLTFAYLLPRSIEHWGARLSLEQKNAFLHLWKVAGYLMGIRTELTTDQWDEAEDLYRRIMARQGYGCPQGQVLTHAVVKFTAEYLPGFLGKRSRPGTVRIGTEERDALPCFPQIMVIDQAKIDRPFLEGLKDRPEDQRDPAVMLLGADAVRDCGNWRDQFVYRALRFLLRRYFFVTDRLLKPFGFLSNFVRELVRGSGRELYLSFKGEYLRRPFYIPSDSTEWTLEPGVTAEFKEKVHDWRRGLFLRIAAGLMAAVFFTVFTLVFFVSGAMKCLILFGEAVNGELAEETRGVMDALTLALAKSRSILDSGFPWWSICWISFLGGLLCLIGASILLRWITPAFFARRPHLSRVMQIDDLEQP
ncbi:MAG: DUF2236 domain-containing protein [Verrucomicrobiae bacterium]|nr:DUF2236 domain-containing protein [Verrucomicrobiae bacterium]